MRCRYRVSPFGGAAGGVLLQLAMVGLGQATSIATIGFSALLGAGFASGSLALARRAAPSLESGESDGLIEGDLDDIGLTEEEKRELLAG